VRLVFAEALGQSVLLATLGAAGGVTLGAALVIGTVAGVYPAARAARLVPSEAIPTV
jgi:hypothetical protein